MSSFNTRMMPRKISHLFNNNQKVNQIVNLSPILNPLIPILQATVILRTFNNQDKTFIKDLCSLNIIKDNI